MARATGAAIWRDGAEARMGAPKGELRMILLEHGPEARPAVFDTPRSLIVVRQPDEIGPALARAEALRAGGAWLAGWIGYEAGLALEPRLAALPPGRGLR